MVSFERDHFEKTPTSAEVREAFVPGVWFETTEELFEAEVEAILEFTREFMPLIASGQITVDDLLSYGMLESIHEECYKSIYTWAGKIRKKDLQWVGVPPEKIRDEMYGQMDNIKSWVQEFGWSPKEAALGAHHRFVWIHPFDDGNGRTTRLYADALLFALTNFEEVFEWKKSDSYFEALRESDKTFNVDTLNEVVSTRRIL